MNYHCPHCRKPVVRTHSVRFVHEEVRLNTDNTLLTTKTTVGGYFPDALDLMECRKGHRWTDPPYQPEIRTTNS